MAAVLFGLFGFLLILGSIIAVVRATDWRDRPKTVPQLPMKPQQTFIAQEVIEVRRTRTVKATKGN